MQHPSLLLLLPLAVLSRGTLEGGGRKDSAAYKIYILLFPGQTQVDGSRMLSQQKNPSSAAVAKVLSSSDLLFASTVSKAGRHSCESATGLFANDFSLFCV